MNVPAGHNYCRSGNKGGDTRNKSSVLFRRYLPGSFENKRYGSVFGEDLRGNENTEFGKGLLNSIPRYTAKGKGGNENAGIDNDVTFPLCGLFS